MHNPPKGEPDHKSFYWFGLRCIILRHSRNRHLCGYVRLPHGVKVSVRNPYILGFDVHGGVSYSYKRYNHYRLGKGHWVGFDCNHVPDLADYKNIDYVTEQCKKLAEQVAKTYKK